MPSRLYYSIGRFSDGGCSLVNWPYSDTIGTPLTPEVKISERFTLSDDQSALTYRQMAPDPATFTEPAVHESQHLALGRLSSGLFARPRFDLARG